MPSPPSVTRSGKSIAALVLGVSSIVLFASLVVPLLAIVFGLLGAREVKRSNGTRRGLGMARAGWILGLLGLLGGVVLWVAVVAVVAGTESVSSLEVGQCVELPDDRDEEISRLRTFDCDEPHGAQVFAVGDLGDGNDPYPGVDSVSEMIAAECLPAFERYVGSPYATSVLEVLPIYPTEEFWADDQGYICLAFDPDGDLDSSVEGSNR